MVEVRWDFVGVSYTFVCVWKIANLSRCVEFGFFLQNKPLWNHLALISSGKQTYTHVCLGGVWFLRGEVSGAGYIVWWWRTLSFCEVFRNAKLQLSVILDCANICLSQSKTKFSRESYFQKKPENWLDVWLQPARLHPYDSSVSKASHTIHTWTYLCASWNLSVEQRVRVRIYSVWFGRKLGFGVSVVVVFSRLKM